MLMTWRPPGELEQIRCSDCGCSQFKLYQEVRENQVEVFHTRCFNCGKRGYLAAESTVTTVRKFVQLVDPGTGPEHSPIGEDKP
jgi:hypothetical protein